MKQSAVSFTVLAAVAAMLLAPGTAAAGNAANPDAIELAPLPLPVEFRSDMDRPVAFDASAKVVLDCPDAAAVDWLNRHLADRVRVRGANRRADARGR